VCRTPCRRSRLRSALWLLLLASTPVLAQPPLSDPTAPLQRPGGRVRDATQPSWQLQSTLVAPERRVAVINGVVVGENDSIDGARVVAIESTTVLLDAGGRALRLWLFSAEPAADDPRGNQ
jgi:MSHA biogenesis protein MshK